MARQSAFSPRLSCVDVPCNMGFPCSIPSAGSSAFVRSPCLMRHACPAGSRGDARSKSKSRLRAHRCFENPMSCRRSATRSCSVSACGTCSPTPKAEGNDLHQHVDGGYGCVETCITMRTRIRMASSAARLAWPESRRNDRISSQGVHPIFLG